jgi:hypothetical protein
MNNEKLAVTRIPTRASLLNRIGSSVDSVSFGYVLRFSNYLFFGIWVPDLAFLSD